MDSLDDVLVYFSDFARICREDESGRVDRGLEFILYWNHNNVPGLENASDFLREVDYRAKPTDKEIYNLFRYWNKGVVPTSIKGMRNLREYGLTFPLTYRSPNFAKLSILAMYVLLSGYVIDKEYMVVYKHHENHPSVQEALNIFPSVPHRYIHTTRLREPDTNSVGHLLTLIGIPVTTRKSEGLRLPDYLRELTGYVANREWQKLDNEQLHELSLARTLIYDAIIVMLTTRLKAPSEYSGFRLRLPGQRVRSDAELLANDAERLLQVGYPEVDWKFSILEWKATEQKSPDLYVPVLGIPIQTAQIIAMNYDIAKKVPQIYAHPLLKNL